MTFSHRLVSFAARDLSDEDGRPVAEVASPLYARTPTALVTCPYADARAGGVMNRSALDQMRGVWPDLLAAAAALSRPDPTVHDAWVAAVTGISLPLVGPTPTPRLLAALFKTSLGLSQVFTALLLADDGVADAPLDTLGDGDGFFAALDAGRWLVGADQVCAGSRAHIVAMFEAIAGRGQGRVCPPEIERLRGDTRRAPEIVALHAAHLAASAHRAGVAVPAAPPWLRAVAAIPGRPPEHARRLFPAGQAPASLERYLAAPGDAAFDGALDDSAPVAGT
jgi:hypothetical protein